LEVALPINWLRELPILTGIVDPAGDGHAEDRSGEELQDGWRNGQAHETAFSAQLSAFSQSTSARWPTADS
jgi:hypothetical protein